MESLIYAMRSVGRLLAAPSGWVYATLGLLLSMVHQPGYALNRDCPTGTSPAVSCAYTLPTLRADPTLALDKPLSTELPIPASTDWRQWRGVLFRIEAPPIRDRAPVVSYMMGTLHFGSLQELNLNADKLLAALKQSRLFIDEAHSPERWPTRLEAFRSLNPPPSLVDLLGPASFSTLTQLIPDIEPAQLQRMKPWLALALLESRGEASGEQTLDRQLAAWARQDDIPIFHLETLEAQLQALDCVPPAEHASVLRQRLATPWLFEEQSQRVLEFYQAGDLPAWLDEIEAMTGLDAAAAAIEHRARLCLIEERNARWLVQLDPLLRADSAFVAIGAIHLTGKDGLLAGLQQRGFVISALAR